MNKKITFLLILFLTAASAESYFSLFVVKKYVQDTVTVYMEKCNIIKFFQNKAATSLAVPMSVQALDKKDLEKQKALEKKILKQQKALEEEKRTRKVSVKESRGLCKLTTEELSNIILARRTSQGLGNMAKRKKDDQRLIDCLAYDQIHNRNIFVSCSKADKLHNQESHNKQIENMIIEPSSILKLSSEKEESFDNFIATETFDASKDLYASGKYLPSAEPDRIW